MDLLCKKDRLITIGEHYALWTLRSVNTACRLCLCQARLQARHFHCTRLACFTQAHASCLKHFDFLRVKVPNTVPFMKFGSLMCSYVLLNAFLRYQPTRLHTFVI